MDPADKEFARLFAAEGTNVVQAALSGRVNNTAAVDRLAPQTPLFVSDDGYDLCVICRAKTEYKTETPIDWRQCYVEGCGQLCFRCWMTKDGAC